MKRPSISFDKDAIIGFLLAHGEKIGVAIVAALACSLVWAGVSAARSKTATREQQPAVIEEQAGRAAAHSQAVPSSRGRRSAFTLQPGTGLESSALSCLLFPPCPIQPVSVLK